MLKRITIFLTLVKWASSIKVIEKNQRAKSLFTLTVEAANARKPKIIKCHSCDPLQGMDLEKQMVPHSFYKPGVLHANKFYLTPSLPENNVGMQVLNE